MTSSFWVKSNKRPDMTIAVDWDAKHQLKQTNVNLALSNIEISMLLKMSMVLIMQF